MVLSGLTRKFQLEVAGNQKPKIWQTAVKTLKIDKCSLGKWGGGGQDNFNNTGMFLEMLTVFFCFSLQSALSCRSCSNIQNN